MSIMTRFTRLFKADVHGVMDQFEDNGLMLRQCLREMESALTARRAVLDRKIEARDTARSDLKTRREEIAALEADIDMAIAKDRDDIARFLIKKEKPLSRHCAELARHVETLDREINDAQADLDRRRNEYDVLKLKASRYLDREKREKDADWPRTHQWPATEAATVTDEEVELELLRRKEGRKEGAA